MKKRAEKTLLISSAIILILLIIFLSIKPFEKSEETNNNTNTTQTYCTEEQKQAEVCTLEYNPVCGDNKRIYSNPCFACSSGEIEYWTPGNCE